MKSWEFHIISPSLTILECHASHKLFKKETKSIIVVVVVVAAAVLLLTVWCPQTWQAGQNYPSKMEVSMETNHPIELKYWKFQQVSIV